MAQAAAALIILVGLSLVLAETGPANMSDETCLLQHGTHQAARGKQLLGPNKDMIKLDAAGAPRLSGDTEMAPTGFVQLVSAAATKVHLGDVMDGLLGILVFIGGCVSLFRSVGLPWWLSVCLAVCLSLCLWASIYICVTFCVDQFSGRAISARGQHSRAPNTVYEGGAEAAHTQHTTCPDQVIPHASADEDAKG